MPIIELWHWRVTDPASGRRYVTRYPMTEASALHFDPSAERVPSSWELRPLWHVTQGGAFGRHVAPAGRRVHPPHGAAAATIHIGYGEQRPDSKPALPNQAPVSVSSPST
jgi:hypothetical protein